MAFEKSESGLVRSLSLKDSVMIGVASMIGGAIFVLVGPGMAQAGAALMIAFLLNGVITVFTALTYAELGSAFPATGGGYKWVREGLPRPNAYLSGWMAWFGHTIAGSLYAVAFGSFFAHLLITSGIIGDDTGIPVDKIFAIIAIIIFTFVNVRGSSDTGKVGNAITFTQLAIIGILIAAAIGAMMFANPNWSDNYRDFLPSGVAGLALAMGLTFIAFEGYEIISQAGDEIKNPRKNIPRAIMISLGIVVSVYIVFTFVFIGGLNESVIGMPAWEFIGSFGELGIIEAADQFLPFGALIVLAGGLVSTLSALNATTFAASRVSFAMGTQYNLPFVFSKIHPKYRTPFVATIVSGIIMLVLAVSMDLTAIAFAASVMFLFLFTQVNLASITIRRLYASTVDYGFKTPLFPLIPIIGIVTAMGLSIYLLFTHPESWLIAIIWIAIGFVIYKFYTSKKELEHNAPLVFTQGPKLRKKYRVLMVFDKRSAKRMYTMAKSIAKDKDRIVHMAAILGTSETITTYDVEQVVLVNVVGTVRILKAAKKFSVPRVVLPTTPDVPWLNPYKITKQAIEKFSQLFNKEYGVETIALKLGNIYGPRERWLNASKDAPFNYQKIIPTILIETLRGNPVKIYGDGNQKSEYIFVNDVVESFARALKTDKKLGGEVIHIGRNKNYSVNDVIETLEQCWNRKIKKEYIKMRPGETPIEIVLDNKKLKSLLDYELQWDLARGLKDTIPYYENAFKNI